MRAGADGDGRGGFLPDRFLRRKWENGLSGGRGTSMATRPNSRRSRCFRSFLKGAVPIRRSNFQTFAGDRDTGIDADPFFHQLDIRRRGIVEPLGILGIGHALVQLAGRPVVFSISVDSISWGEA